MANNSDDENLGLELQEGVPEAVGLYASWLAEELEEIFESRLVGVYLHGSAAMGGWHPGRSDVDILAVVDGLASDDEKQRLSDAILSAGHRPPGTGLEFSLVSTSTFAAPGNAPAFELHLTTGANAKVVDGAGHPGDPDLVLHYAVCRTRGVTFHGSRPKAVLPSQPGSTLLEALAAELEWARRNAPSEYAVLNACRAWAFAAEGRLLSKIEGGEWAIAQGIAPAAVAAALEAQRGHAAPVDKEAVSHLVDSALAALADARRAESQ